MTDIKQTIKSVPSIPGFEWFREVKRHADKVLLNEVEVLLISYDLIKNKLTVGRLKDHLDIEELKKRKASDK